MAKKRLSEKLLKKIAQRTGHKVKYMREQVSKRAGKLGISSEAALVLWAKDFKLGTATYQQSLPPHIQEQINRNIIQVPFLAATKITKTIEGKKVTTRSHRASLGSAIDILIQDKELNKRCKDLLKAKGNFDRVIREATTILDDRIKKIAGLRGMRPVDVIGKALNPDPTQAIIKISDEKFEQEGFFSICKGLTLAFRNTTHHEISNKFTREDALKFCGFVDTILAALNKARKNISP